MLLIQLKLIINLLLLLIDFILLIKLMPAKMAVDQRPYGRRPRLEGPRIKAWTSRLWDYWEIGQPAPPPLATSYSPVECCKLRIRPGSQTVFLRQRQLF